MQYIQPFLEDPEHSTKFTCKVLLIKIVCPLALTIISFVSLICTFLINSPELRKIVKDVSATGLLLGLLSMLGYFFSFLCVETPCRTMNFNKNPLQDLQDESNGIEEDEDEDGYTSLNEPPTATV